MHTEAPEGASLLKRRAGCRGFSCAKMLLFGVGRTRSKFCEKTTNGSPRVTANAGFLAPAAWRVVVPVRGTPTQAAGQGANNTMEAQKRVTIEGNGQHAGLMLSPSKKSKISPDSVVMITPLPNAMSSSMDGLSGEEVSTPPPERLATLLCAPRPAPRAFGCCDRDPIPRTYPARSSSPTATATPTRTTSSCRATLISARPTSTCARWRRSASR